MNKMNIILTLAIILACYPAFSTAKKNLIQKDYKIERFENIRLEDSRVSELVSSSLKKRNFKNEGTVLIEYHIEENGNIVIDQLNTNNEKLGVQVKTCLSTLCVLSKSAENKIFYVKYIFKLL